MEAKNGSMTPSDVPKLTSDAVLVKSEPLPEGQQAVKGYAFEGDTVDYDALLKSYVTSGFQATHFGQAVDTINGMVRLRSSFCCRCSGAVF